MKFDQTKLPDDYRSSELEASRPAHLVKQVRQRLALHSSARPNIGVCPRARRLFAREIVDRRRRIQGADSSSFVALWFSGRFGSRPGRGFNEGKIYREPGRVFRHTSLKSFAQLFMSFDLKRFAQSLQMLFHRIRNQQNFNAAAYLNLNQQTNSFAIQHSESFVRQHSEIYSSAPASQFVLSERTWLTKSSVITSASRANLQLASPNALAVAGQVEHQVIERQMFNRYSVARGLTVNKSARNSFAQSITNLGQRTTLKERVAQILSRTLLNFTRVRNAERVWLQRTVDSGKADLQVAGTRPLSISRAVNQLSLITSARRMRERSETAHRVLRNTAAQVLSPFAQRFNFQYTSRAMTTSESSRETVVLSTERPSSARTLWQRQTVFATETVMNQSRLLVERTLGGPKFFGTKLLAQFVTPYQSIERVSRPLALPEFGRPRDSAPKAPPEFVFAQTARQEVRGEQVVKRVETREILEMVKKEVKQSMTNVLSLRNFNRQDFEEISDRVYSALVRRLTIERERLGLS